MPGFHFSHFGSPVFAYLHALFASGVELASFGRICGRRDIALQDYTVHLVVRIRYGYRGKKSFGIGMEGMGIKAFRIRILNHVTQVHYAYGVGYVLNHRQIV